MYGALFEQTWIPFTQGCFVQILVKIGQVVQKKDIFELRQCIFTISLLSRLENGHGFWFLWTNLNPIHPRMLCLKFGWNWPSGSGEDDENVKSDRQWQTTDKFRSGNTRLSLRLSWAKKHLPEIPMPTWMCLFANKSPWDTLLTWETIFFINNQFEKSYDYVITLIRREKKFSF